RARAARKASQPPCAFTIESSKGGACAWRRGSYAASSRGCEQGVLVMTRPKRAVPASSLPVPDKPWLIRTYSGHSTAAKSNALYRKNLAKGQTGLSIAFDLPTQTGYDSDHELARGEVGKVGVPISHLGDMRALLAGIPLAQMNTSMTINATAA